MYNPRTICIRKGGSHRIVVINVKIFQIMHSTCCITGQYVLCGKEKLTVREYVVDDQEIEQAKAVRMLIEV